MLLPIPQPQGGKPPTRQTASADRPQKGWLRRHGATLHPGQEKAHQVWLYVHLGTLVLEESERGIGA